MSYESSEKARLSELRTRALSRLAGGSQAPATRGNQADAFQALYDLALTPATAPRALALLHELQVHQVEVDLQEEELRRSRAEVETALARLTHVYDFVPVGLLTIDGALTVSELNRAGSIVLGLDRDEIVGVSLDFFLDPYSARVLRAALARVDNGTAVAPSVMKLTRRGGEAHRLHASVSRDPDGRRFLLAVLDAGPERQPD
jgi:PAS domain-containing protein